MYYVVSYINPELSSNTHKSKKTIDNLKKKIYIIRLHIYKLYAIFLQIL